MSDVLDLAKIRLDGGTQPRSATFEDLIVRYGQDMARGDPFPPLVVFFDGTDHWLADGFHRYHAAKAAGRAAFSCDVRQGTQRDAILYSFGVNTTHGGQRTQEDARRAVRRMLEDPEWAAWSDREIGRHCKVDGKTVAGLRPAPAPVADTAEFRSMERTFVHPKTGAPAVMRTANIGRRPDAGQAAELPQVATPTPSPVRAFNARMDVEGPIWSALDAMRQQFAGLPPACEAAALYPRSFQPAFTPTQARYIADWLNAFADEWDATHGDAHVAA